MIVEHFLINADLSVSPETKILKYPSGGSRISGGANSSGGAPTYDFAKFSQKLHEIERIWSPKFYYVELYNPIGQLSGFLFPLDCGQVPSM